MEKNEFYLSSLELVKERIENRLNEAENTDIENETESLFDWMLSQLHWKMECFYPVVERCRIEFSSISYGHSLGLRYSYVSEYHTHYVNFYEDFITVLKNVTKIFDQHKNFKVLSFDIPKRNPIDDELCIVLEFSI